MGCDIHMVVEVKHEDEWVGLHAFPHLSGEAYLEAPITTKDGSEVQLVGAEWLMHHLSSRNYEFFAALAGVRGDGPEALGAPEDASALARMEIESWGSDGHSHSHCSARHFLMVAAELKQVPDPVRTAVEEGTDCSDAMRHDAARFLGIDRDLCLETEARVVFWFDN